VGGAASAPIVASAFHPSLATVGVLLAVFGYAVGTIAAIGCTILMELVSSKKWRFDFCYRFRLNGN